MTATKRFSTAAGDETEVQMFLYNLKHHGQKRLKQTRLIEIIGTGVILIEIYTVVVAAS